LTIAEIRARVGAALAQHLGVTKQQAATLLPVASSAGKLYEAYILGIVARELVVQEGLKAVLRNAPRLVLKTAPGPINRQYPWVDLLRNGTVVGELWTDVDFVTLSYERAALASPPQQCHYHELDIVVVPPGTQGRPRARDISLGIECKATDYDKSLLREILGIRRELSLLSNPLPTAFTKWPRPSVPARPPSCVIVYSTDPAIATYAPPGDIFGIDFVHEPLQ
jgi:hypothetical protein